MLSAIESQVLSYLKEHSRAVKSCELEQQLNIDGFLVRNAVNTLRRNALPIVSGKYGYAYSSDISAIEYTIQNLNCRVQGIRAAIEGLSLARINAERGSNNDLS